MWRSKRGEGGGREDGGREGMGAEGSKPAGGGSSTRGRKNERGRGKGGKVENEGGMLQSMFGRGQGLSITCKRCNNSGEVVCWTCRGQGKLSYSWGPDTSDCPTCSAKKVKQCPTCNEQYLYSVDPAKVALENKARAKAAAEADRAAERLASGGYSD